MSRCSWLHAKAFFVALVVTVIVGALFCFTTEDRMTLSVAIIAVIVAGTSVWVTYRFGEIQRQQAIGQERFAKEQAELTTSLQRLGLVPVLAAQFDWNHNGRIRVRNSGNGPALDIRVEVYQPYNQDGEVLWAHALAELPNAGAFLGTDDGLIEIDVPAAIKPGGGAVQLLEPVTPVSVWILHYADVSGHHWHTWSNWERDQDVYESTGTFVFDSRHRTPDGLCQRCHRCLETPLS